MPIARLGNRPNRQQELLRLEVHDPEVMATGERRLRLLSLDGGGVRGLSSVKVLQDVMRAVNIDRPVNSQLQPWQFFDMMGGTSTGGLLAIMLGRLRMSLDDCETAYLRLSESIFTPKRTGIDLLGRAKDKWKASGKFDHKGLESSVIDIIVQSKQATESISRKEAENMLLRDDGIASCKVSVLSPHAEKDLFKCSTALYVQSKQ